MTRRLYNPRADFRAGWRPRFAVVEVRRDDDAAGERVLEHLFEGDALVVEGGLVRAGEDDVGEVFSRVVVQASDGVGSPPRVVGFRIRGVVRARERAVPGTHQEGPGGAAEGGSIRGVLGANSGRGGVAAIPPERAPGGDAAGRPTGPWRCDSLAGSAPIGAVSASSSTRGRRMVFRWCFVAARRDLRRGEARGRTVREDSRGVATRRARGRGTRISRLGQREIRGAPLARRARTSPCVLRDARGVCSSPFRRPRRAWPRLHRARARSGVQSNARDPTNARSFSAPL